MPGQSEYQGALARNESLEKGAGWLSFQSPTALCRCLSEGGPSIVCAATRITGPNYLTAQYGLSGICNGCVRKDRASF